MFQTSDALSDILHVVFQGKQRGRLLMTLEAYFDETGDNEIPRLFLAGYLSDFDHWQEFRTKWAELLRMCGDIPFFRMYDCLTGTGVFKHYHDQPAFRTQAAKLAIEIIKPTIAVGIAVGIDTVAFDDLTTPKFRKGFGEVYTFGTNMCLDRLSVRPETKALEGEIVYIFEKGAPHWKQADKIMHRIEHDPELKKKYRYKTHLFLEKHEALPLQAADCFANLFLKSYRDDLSLVRLHPLHDLLVDNGKVPHVWEPFERDRLKKVLVDTLRHHDDVNGTHYSARLGDWVP